MRININASRIKILLKPISSQVGRNNIQPLYVSVNLSVKSVYASGFLYRCCRHRFFSLLYPRYPRSSRAQHLLIPGQTSLRDSAIGMTSFRGDHDASFPPAPGGSCLVSGPLSAVQSWSCVSDGRPNPGFLLCMEKPV